MSASREFCFRMVLGSVVWFVFVEACPAQAVPGLKKLLRLDLGTGVMMDFVLIRPGSFTMGSDERGNVAFVAEKPVHKVTITKPFYLGKYLVTQEQWEAVMGNNKSRFKGPKNPMESVSWDDCQAFCAKLGASYRGTFRLPTEAQWEYACRAGSTGKYCFGDSETQLGEYAWYSENSGNKTHPVGQKKPNAWGLYDMHGNVWEWCQDWYESGYYAGSPKDDPTGPETGSYRVNRGGGWNFTASFCRSATRINLGPGRRGAFLGLRVSRVLVDK